MNTSQPWQNILDSLHHHRSLLAIVFCYIILVGIYSGLIPPFEGPDEAQHFAYIEWLALDKGFPPQGDAAWETPIKQEAGQPPLYYFLASIPARIVGVENPPAVYRENPYFVAPLPRDTPDNDNRAIHYPTDGQPLRGGWLGLYLARGVTILFGILLVISVYGLAREVVPNKPQIAAISALLVAITPQIVYLSGMVSNDIPAAAVSTVVLWLLAVNIRRGPTTASALGLGLAFGASVLLKVNSMTLGLPIAIGFLWLLLSNKYDRALIIKAALWSALGVTLVAGWWFARSLIIYGSPLGLETHDNTPWVINDAEEIAKPLARWLEVARSYWIALGWGIIRPDGWVYTVLFVFSLIGLGGIGFATWRWWQQPEPRGKTTPILVVILALSLLSVGVLLEYWMHQVVAPYGRLIFPAIGAIAILLSMGWRAIHPKFAIPPLFFVGGITLLAPFTLIIPSYKPPPLLTEAEIAQLSNGVGWQFRTADGEPLAELIDVIPARESASAGTVLPVQVCWRALGEVDRSYTVLLQLIGPENGLISHRRSYPGQGMIPTELWNPGDTFCDMMHVHVWLDLANTLVYQVEVALFDEETGKRLPAFDQNGNQLTHNFVNRVRLEKLEPVMVSENITQIDDSGIQLVSHEVSEIWNLGKANSFKLSWVAARSINEDYQVFVHLRDPVTGDLVAQADGPPVGGWYPTSWWPIGELISDVRIFELPDAISPGQYDLVVGFYDLNSGVRFGSEHFVGTIEVES